MTTSEERIETWFLIPLVPDSDKTKPHVATIWRFLRAELYDFAGGESSKPVVIEDVELISGSWQNPKTGASVSDQSRKYTMIIARDRVDALREVLERAANSFDQEEILFMVLGVEKPVKRDPAKGYLKGDPAGG